MQSMQSLQAACVCMSIKIGSNIASLQAQRRLSESSQSLQRTFERLSSGQRINRASDDAAGLAVSEQLNAHSKVFNQAVRNINDGLSYLNIADGALQQLSTILTRQQELATQAASGIYSSKQRQALNQEYGQLTDEYNRIMDSTSFNNRTIFDANARTLAIQAGFGSETTMSVSLGKNLLPVEISEGPAGTQETAEITIVWPGVGADDLAANLIYFQSGSAIAQNSAVMFNYSSSNYYGWFNVDGGGSDPGLAGTGIEVNISSSDTADQVAAAFGAALMTPFYSSVGSLVPSSPETIINGITGSGISYESLQDQYIEINGQIINLQFGGTTSRADFYLVLASSIDSSPGMNVSATTDGNSISIVYDSVGDQPDLSYSSSALSVMIVDGSGTPSVNQDGTYHLAAIDILTQDQARSAITSLADQLSKVIAERGNIGAAQQKLSTRVDVLRSMSEGYLQARSRIVDADIASESADLTRQRILQQSAASILAQANQAPSLALQLLS